MFGGLDFVPVDNFQGVDDYITFVYPARAPPTSSLTKAGDSSSNASAASTGAHMRISSTPWRDSWGREEEGIREGMKRGAVDN